MKRRATFSLFALIFLFAAEARADSLVLVHGYLGNGYSWESRGVANALAADKWQRTATMRIAFGGVRCMPFPPSSKSKSDKKIYFAELPSAAPVVVQADQLRAMVNKLAKKYPDENIYLAGHSVGGVVARAALVKGKLPGVKALITIASPHLGTPRAEQAIDVTDYTFPFGAIGDIFGGDGYNALKHSRGLLFDITSPRPGSFLFWLNQQRHPDLKYVSIVRSAPFVWGDLLVPGPSQDMNNVPALAGKSKVYPVGSGHFLNPGDGALIARVLREMVK